MMPIPATDLQTRTSADAALLDAAKRALDYFSWKTTGYPVMGSYDVILIGRQLHEAIQRVEQERTR